jgi:hypothetical protein
MATDLPKRLREYGEFISMNSNVYCTEIIDEAAAHIERLTAEVEWLAVENKQMRKLLLPDTEETDRE